jgi:hypothetical protein
MNAEVNLYHVELERGIIKSCKTNHIFGPAPTTTVLFAVNLYDIGSYYAFLCSPLQAQFNIKMEVYSKDGEYIHTCVPTSLSHYYFSFLKIELSCLGTVQSTSLSCCSYGIVSISVEKSLFFLDLSHHAHDLYP